MHSSNQPKLRLVFYGDDFTGSTDALEVLTAAGLKCALFLTPPSPELLEDLGGFDAIGIAGDSRALSNAEMDEALPSIFEAVKRLSPALVHYKVCSTFDSAPDVGSIGHVIELASQAFGVKGVPIVAGNPTLGRYCVFGNLFALSKTDNCVHRIDRHPIMRAHPITPMREGDLSIHIGLQGNLSIEKVDIRQLEQGADLAELVREASLRSDAVLIDGTTDAHMTLAGEVLTELSTSKIPLFVVGSSGVEYGLTQHWHSLATTAAYETQVTPLQPAKQVLVVSGSASPLSRAQIDAAIAGGFIEVVVDAAAIIAGAHKDRIAKDVVATAVAHLETGRSVLIHTAKGQDDPRIERMIGVMTAEGLPRDEARTRGGMQLAVEMGYIVLDILKAHPLGRLVISGGDTSSQITKVLAPDALVIKSYISPGAPLCLARSSKPYMLDLEIALKGGQMGEADYFVKALTGSS
jgi:uncharacterized protein YgbK (DUF1537 family)